MPSTPEQKIAEQQVAQEVASMPHPLKRVCMDWLGKLEVAKARKQEQFGRYATEAANFFDGPLNWMWQQEVANANKGGFLEQGTELPRFRMTCNKPFESVALFGPALYFQNPDFAVNHVPLPIPVAEATPTLDPLMFQQLMLQQQAKESSRKTQAEYFAFFINWLIQETGLKEQVRQALTEAMVKGMGCLWVDMYEPISGSIRYPRAEYFSVDDLQQDPDATQRSNVQWIARRYVEPRNVVERKFNLPAGSIKGSYQSGNLQGTVQPPNTTQQPHSSSNPAASGSFDLVEYWDIYSKNGFGDRLKSAAERTNIIDGDQMNMEWAGDFCRIVVCKGVPFPLNAPSWALDDQEALRTSIEWKVPFYADEHCGGGWPVVPIYFYEKMNSVWPLSMFKPVMGELRFINWCMSFLADKTAQSCTTYVAKMKSVALEIKKQLEEGGGGMPFVQLEVGEVNGNLEQALKFIQSPDFPASIWQMISQVMEQIDKRTGLTELVYGLSSRQMRSAAEANVKDQNVSVRPDDMANKVEDALSMVGMKFIEAARWLLDGKDVEPILGPLGAQVWDSQVLMDDVESVVRDYHFRVVAGSARKQNKQQKAQALQEFGQYALPVFQSVFQLGNPAPLNAFLTEWAKANDIDPAPFQIQALPPQLPQSPPPPVEGQPNEQMQTAPSQPEGDQQPIPEGAFVG